MPPSTLTLHIDHMLLVEGKGSTTTPIMVVDFVNKGGNPEYLRQ